jgi:hypothetical protein
MHPDRSAFHDAKVELLSLQRKLKRPPDRRKVNHYVHSLILHHGLRYSSVERYFRLLATSALLGRESMYYQFEPKHKRRTK